MVEKAFLLLATRVAIIGDAPLGGLLPAVRFPAAKGASQVVPAGIARVGQEVNATMPASGQAASQLRLGMQNRPQEPTIFQHQDGDRAPAIPLGPKLEFLRNPDCKKPKRSLKRLMERLISSFYLSHPVTVEHKRISRYNGSLHKHHSVHLLQRRCEAHVHDAGVCQFFLSAATSAFHSLLTRMALAMRLFQVGNDQVQVTLGRGQVAVAE